MKHIATRLQANWDWRAAGNFVFGAAGGCLLAIAAAASFPAPPPMAVTLVSLALIGAGLGLVWLELGRPWRAINVFFHGETSWMTREAIVATVLFPLALLGLVADVPGLVQAAAVAGLGYAYCQARMLQGSKGIVTWREPAVIPFMVLTGLTEGAGLLLVAGAALPLSTAWPPYLAMLLVVLRCFAWMHYRGRINAQAAPLQARNALKRINPPVLILGHLLPLFLLIAGQAMPNAAYILKPTAGLLMVGAGWFIKTRILLTASYQQGYAFGRLRKGLPNDY